VDPAFLGHGAPSSAPVACTIRSPTLDFSDDMWKTLCWLAAGLHSGSGTPTGAGVRHGTLCKAWYPPKQSKAAMNVQ
jgi:hypothetical protein